MKIEENLKDSFPSQFVPSSVKQSTQYCKKYAESFHTEASHLPTESALVRGNKNYDRFRKYARGEQSEAQYKEMMGLKRASKGGPPNTSFRNINFEILKIAPKLRNVLVNKIVNQPLNMRARPIDPRSASKRRSYKSALTEFIFNKEQIEHFEYLTKLGLSRPVGDGEAPPSNIAEIDPFIDMNPKDVASMEVVDFLTKCFYENDWEQLGREIAGDLVDLGIGGTRQFLDHNNKIRFRRIVPENAVTNLCIFPDYRDLIRFGEYRQITVSELKRITKGSLGEEAYKDIANRYAGNSMANKYPGLTRQYWNESTYSYAYDQERVTIFECMWYSTDTEVHVEYMNESGNKRVKQMAFDYVPFKGDMNVNGGKGLSDQEYNKMNEGKKRIYRTEVRNVYQCSWVVGSDYVFDCGLMPNMLRATTSWQETVMPVTLITTDFISTIGLIEQPLDQVQLNYLQYQSHVAASKPPGIAIEKNALARIGKTGQGGKKWDPKEDLIMYAETGNLVYDGYDVHNNPLNQLPFKELVNGLSQGASDHLALVAQWIQNIRDMLGINALTEGQTPPERLGKKVAELSFGATDNALSHLTAAYRAIYQKTARNLFLLLQNNIQKMQASDISESLGDESYKYFMLNRDLALMDMGIILEEGPDDVKKEKISALLQLMVENKEIPGEDAIMIENIDNPYRQILLIRKHRIERERAEAAKQENLVRAQGEEQTKLAVAQEEAARKTEEAKHGMKLKEKEVDAMIEREKERQDQAFQLMMKRMDIGGEMSEGDKNRMNDLLEIMLKGQNDLKKQRLANQAKPKTVTAK